MYYWLIATTTIIYCVLLFLYIKKIHKEKYSQKREILLIVSLFAFLGSIIFLGDQDIKAEKLKLSENIKNHGTKISQDIFVFESKRYIQNKHGEFILIKE